MRKLICFETYCYDKLFLRYDLHYLIPPTGWRIRRMSIANVCPLKHTCIRVYYRNHNSSVWKRTPVNGTVLSPYRRTDQSTPPSLPSSSQNANARRALLSHKRRETHHVHITCAMPHAISKAPLLPPVVADERQRQRIVGVNRHHITTTTPGPARAPPWRTISQHSRATVWRRIVEHLRTSVFVFFCGFHECECVCVFFVRCCCTVCACARGLCRKA